MPIGIGDIMCIDIVSKVQYKIINWKITWKREEYYCYSVHWIWWEGAATYYYNTDTRRYLDKLYEKCEKKINYISNISRQDKTRNKYIYIFHSLKN